MPTKIADVGADALREARSNLDPDYVPSDDEELQERAAAGLFPRPAFRLEKIDPERIRIDAGAFAGRTAARTSTCADRASSETDWAIELRTRDRQRKLIAKIDSAIRRIDEGEYGYCAVTGEPISLARLQAAPDRDDDAGGAGASRAQRTDFARRLIARPGAPFTIPQRPVPRFRDPDTQRGEQVAMDRAVHQSVDEEVAALSRGADRDSLFMQASLILPGQPIPWSCACAICPPAECSRRRRPRIAQGTTVEVELRNVGQVPGRVVWAGEGKFGIAFDRPVDPQAVRRQVVSESDLPPHLRRTGLEQGPLYRRR